MRADGGEGHVVRDELGIWLAWLASLYVQYITVVVHVRTSHDFAFYPGG